MSLNAPSDYFFTDDTPEDFRQAVQSSDHAVLRAWCRQNPDKVRQALEWVHYHHKVHRDIILLEIEDLKQKDLIQRLKAIERLHWAKDPIFWVTLGGAVAAGLAAYFGWLAIRP
jgi:hypothetical protein